jgi:hypothetical protein
MKNYSTALLILILSAFALSAFGQQASTQSENNVTLRVTAGDTIRLKGFYPGQIETAVAKAGSTRAYVEIQTAVYGGSGNATQAMVGEILRPTFDRTDGVILISSQAERLIRVTTQYGNNCRWEQKLKIIAPEGVVIEVL